MPVQRFFKQQKRSTLCRFHLSFPQRPRSGETNYNRIIQQLAPRSRATVLPTKSILYAWALPKKKRVRISEAKLNLILRYSQYYLSKCLTRTTSYGSSHQSKRKFYQNPLLSGRPQSSQSPTSTWFRHLSST